MKTIDIRFNVSDGPLLTESTRVLMLQHYKPITQDRLAELWNKRIPTREKLSTEVSGTCVSIMDDWMCTIFGKSYAECIGALGIVHNFLVSELGLRITFELLLPARGPGTLDDLLRRERWWRMGRRAVEWTVATLIGIGIGYGINMALS